MAVILYGYHFSVYSRSVRMALIEKGAAYAWREIDPFADEPSSKYLALHPFGRTPTLVDHGFVVYETAAINRYLDETLPGPTLQPADPRRRARMNQIIGVVDSYVYWPMVRVVSSLRLFEPQNGEEAGERFARGLRDSARALDALEALAEGGEWLVGDAPSLADLHLAPMLGCFTQVAEGAALLMERPILAACFARIAERASFQHSDPGPYHGGDA